MKKSLQQFIFISLLFMGLCPTAFAQIQAPWCPEIWIYMGNELEGINSVATFTVEVMGFPRPEELKYEWLVTPDLEIISGQGTKYLEVKRASDDVDTATVTISGLPAGCKNSGSDTLPAIDRRAPVLVDEVDKASIGHYKARIDNLFIKLWDYPGAHALIVIYRRTDSLSRAKEMFKYITFLKKDKSRVSFVFTSNPGELIRFWIVPDGAGKPVLENPVYVKPDDVPNLKKIPMPAKIIQKNKRSK